MPGQKKNSSGNSLKSTMLLKMFEETIRMQTALTIELKNMCGDMKDNTQAMGKLCNHLSGVPNCMREIKRTVNLIKYGLLPVVSGLIGLVIFFALR